MIVSQPESKSASRGRGVQVQKPQSNVYTVMLLISLVALIVGCVLLYLEIDAYGGFAAAEQPAAPVYAHATIETGSLAV